MNYVDLIEKVAAEISQVKDLMTVSENKNKYKNSPFEYNTPVLQDMDIEKGTDKDVRYRFHANSFGRDKENEYDEDPDMRHLHSYFQDPIRARKKQEDLSEYDKRVGSHINKYVERGPNRYSRAGALAGLSLGALYGYMRHGRADSDDSLPTKLLTGSAGVLRGALLPGFPLMMGGMVAGYGKDAKRRDKLQSEIYESMTPKERQILINERNRVFDEHLRGISDKETPGQAPSYDFRTTAAKSLTMDDLS